MQNLEALNKINDDKKKTRLKIRTLSWSRFRKIFFLKSISVIYYAQEKNYKIRELKNILTILNSKSNQYKVFIYSFFTKIIFDSFV